MATSKNPKNSVAKSEAALRRPFAPDVLRRARAVARTYQVVLWFAEEEKEYYGRCLELPIVMGDGKTPDACMRSVRAAIKIVLGVMLERGESLPAPASEANRTEQINVRLTRQEKFILETAARSQGYHGVSDYVRSRALSKAG